ncbi:hypothetical protein [Deinococcus psychrotolerans]|uniref:hypothetical protein n=1 Tax=Deinococcus psychrotolerans TaxID=2489213 RepID=UPI0013DE25B8|nr:hypothetical protein [Deinococcus psychrotolerans]
MSSPNSAPSGGAAASQGSASASNTSDVPIDLKILAEKVYRLLLADISIQKRRISQERR